MENEEFNKILEEYKYKLQLMEIFQEFLININKKLEINELADYILKFIKNSFNVKSCSIILNNERFAIENLNNEKILESEKIILNEVFKNKEAVFIRSTKNDTLLHELKNEIDLSLISMPILNENKIIAVINIYDEIEKINKNDINILKNFLEKSAPAINNSIEHNIIKIKNITDNLTEIYTKQYFIDNLRKEIRQFQKYLSLIMLDIDYFKNYNDKNGHLAGDYLLKEIASLIKKNLRNNDIVARYGGEEFIILLPETDNSSALQICERLRNNIENYEFKFKENQPEKKLTISLGLITTVTKEIELNYLINEADKNLYKSKKFGRNKTTHSIIINKNLQI